MQHIKARLQVVWATDPLVQWREGVGVGANKDNTSSSSSKLLRAEVPLSRHGRDTVECVASTLELESVTLSP
ncbi:uncharacterized protein CFP56_015341 [Quercus suber]|uniref:Uncharacterized protein n=1 Tax=Quercus suber TaxID=58331 RepID=A0AAW0KQ62_QUESU